MYVILQPYSNTNPTDKYRVVQNTEWIKFARSHKFLEFSTYAEAETVRDSLNGK